MSKETKQIMARIYTIRRGAQGYLRDAIVVIPGINSKAEAIQYLNSRVIWKSRRGKSIVGKVVKLWGKHNHLLVRFRRGLPGQAIGDVVLITKGQ